MSFLTDLGIEEATIPAIQREPMVVMFHCGGPEGEMIAGRIVDLFTRDLHFAGCAVRLVRYGQVFVVVTEVVAVRS